MERDTCDELVIAPPPPESRQAALELVLRELPLDDRKRVASQALQDAAEGRRRLDGLLVAQRGARIVGAVWAEIQPGRTASVWPPQTAEVGSADVDVELLAHLTTLLRDRQVQMAQLLLNADASETAEALRAAAFEHLTDLLYLVSTTGQFPTAPVTRELIFEPVKIESQSRLEAVIDATYEQTLDCPRLNGLRNCHDVIAGYRATSHDDTSHWFLVRRENRDVGCVLLAHHDEIETWEMVYMGLTPAARGAGRGVELARQAQWLVRSAGGHRLMLAVDVVNEPAIKTYAAAGFVAFDRRRVFVRFFNG